MIKATRINDTIVCVIGNKMYQKHFNSDKERIEVYELLLNTNESDKLEIIKIKELFAPKASEKEQKILEEIKTLEKESVEQQVVLEWLNTEKDNPDSLFIVDGFKLYLKGINITIPEFLIKEFVKRKDNQEDTKSLINFWRLLALNNDPRCRENLFTFLSKHELAITPSGYFVAYRNVNVKQEGNKELNEFVAKMWLKVKTWKKSPKNYTVLTINGELEISLETQVSSDLFNQVIGNLQDLYENNTDDGQTVYTDVHSGTFNIKIGEMVSMPKEECDHSQDNECSNGLHVASSSWLSQSYYGSQGIACLVNPMHVVSVPYADAGKLRCYKYLPIGLIEYGEDKKVIPIDTKTFEYEFSEHTNEELQTMLQNSNLEELKTNELIPKELDIESLKNSLKINEITMEEMNKVISNKVIKVND